MNWLSFLIGALVGWLISWLIDYVICRPRRKAAQEVLDALSKQSGAEAADLRVQLAGYRDVQERLDGANAEIATLRAQVATTQDLQAHLEGANAELDALQAQIGATADLQARLDSANREIDSLQAQLAGVKGLQADLVGWKAQATQQGLEIERLNAQLAARAAPPVEPVPAATTEVAADEFTLRAPVTSAAPAAPAEPPQPDDLTRIEGIGPKINALLNQNELYTFAQLAATSVEHLQSILSSAGSRFRLAKPQTWPEQAAFARDGRWEELQAFQDTLKGGRPG